MWLARRGLLEFAYWFSHLLADLIFKNLFYHSELASEKWDQNNYLLTETEILKSKARALDTANVLKMTAV